ncbi:hypothetical protein U1Q18_027519 [Sarracenia purpurea var. burkii]
MELGLNVVWVEIGFSVSWVWAWVGQDERGLGLKEGLGRVWVERGFGYKEVSLFVKRAWVWVERIRAGAKTEGGVGDLVWDGQRLRRWSRRVVAGGVAQGAQVQRHDDEGAEVSRCQRTRSCSMVVRRVLVRCRCVVCWRDAWEKTAMAKINGDGGATTRGPRFEGERVIVPS